MVEKPAQWSECARVFRDQGKYGWETIDLSDWTFADLKEAAILLAISRRDDPKD